MKKFMLIFCLIAVVALPLAAQTIDPCTQNTELAGGTYNVYTSSRINEPSIDGYTTFVQYFSIRQDMVENRRRCGTISVTEHFKKWEELGLKLGNNMYECKFLIEAGSGTGWIDLSYLSFSQEEQTRETEITE
ncbi:MAG: glycoside hydrolase family 11 protein [Prevotellaceae bacterium]|jgi:hypothetical protein|nr:glycoside hydrolase family 11 protein [Prevotellaceae bacterium]